MSARVRLDAVIVAAARFLASLDIGFRSPVTGRPVCVVVTEVAVRTASRSAGRPRRPLSFVVARRYSSGLLNFAAHSPEDSQRDRNAVLRASSNRAEGIVPVRKRRLACTNW
jgi:hypothetical protein